ncbi:hypothetical protein BO86DRAFT_392005 [Aspergillus japonicus CBS 114.51]|uniref:Secreted protein n=1 Tax=Aspergillus japonicus CBS 114.51 TaxID=1448312 RepID=A0A8T8WQR5_ASPJA|nr:hypothetical protein BO86DRAFT_392005 [Aspergillus japonicus CBS 114.51]RAH78188.1 hypothetical protein BO86DRAFT_392005 [Aspergillus japonicus CBS 114.51]
MDSTYTSPAALMLHLAVYLLVNVSVATRKSGPCKVMQSTTRSIHRRSYIHYMVFQQDYQVFPDSLIQKKYMKHNRL